MPILTNVENLLSGTTVEWARIEFKTTWDAEASLKTICAYANDFDNWGGGYIVIGVEEENGKPVRPIKGVSVDSIDRFQKDMLNKCKLIRPDYSPVVEVADFENKKLIIIWAPGGSIRPYSSPRTMSKEDKERVYWIRKFSNTVKPSDAEIKDLFGLANVTPFDDRVNHNASMGDINRDLLLSYLHEAGSALYNQSDKMDVVEICRNLEISGTLPEYTKPKNVALLFFSDMPRKFFRCAQIDVVDFPEGLGGNIINEKTFDGPLHRQLTLALQYIKDRYIQERIIKRPDRAEADRFFNYPYVAIEEALANAIYHKAYNEAEPIEVRVLDNRIEIHNTPGPDRSVTQEDLRTFRVRSRRYRNRRIGDFLKAIHLTEGRNTGFSKILEALEVNGSPRPEFYTDEGHLTFSATIFIHPAFLKQGTAEQVNVLTEHAAEHAVKSTVQDALPNTDTSVSKNTNAEQDNGNTEHAEELSDETLLLFCRQPRTRKEIQEHFGIKSRSHLFTAYLKPLIEEGRLNMADPQKPTSPIQKYIFVGRKAKSRAQQ